MRSKSIRTWVVKTGSSSWTVVTFPSKGQNQSAVAALKWATGARVSGGADGWRAWWREAKKTFDFEEAAERRAEANAKAKEPRKKKKKKRKKS